LQNTQAQLIESEKAAATLRVKHAISHDLHDEVGSTLTSIQLLSKISLEENTDNKSVKILSKINEQTILMQSRIRDIVWSNQAEQFTISSLDTKLKEVSIQLLEPAGIKIKVNDLPATLFSITLPSLHSKNILMIVREALNNIVKHANAKIVSIYWEQMENQTVLHITDDGTGKINMETQGSGLRIMKSRAEEIGAKLEWVPNQEGTHILLKFNRFNI